MNADPLADLILNGNSKDRAKALKLIYSKCFPIVRSFVTKNSGTSEEAKDLFQEAISIAYYNLSENKFRGESSLNQYVIGIGRNLWLQKLKKKTLPTTALATEEFWEEEMAEPVNEHLLSFVISKLKEGCRTILKSFYYDGESMESIAQKLKLGSAQAAKTKKLRCMKKLSSLIEGYGLKGHDFRQ